MVDIQTRLDKRLAGLKKASASGPATGVYSVGNIKVALINSGLITSTGEVINLIENNFSNKQ